jgi:hypothetical protein
MIIYGSASPLGAQPDVVEVAGPRGVRGLRWALAAAVVLLVALGGYIWLDHHRPASERAAVAAVTVYLKAWNAHDAPAVRAAMAPRGGFVAGDTFLRPIVNAPIGPALDDLMDAVFAADLTFETTAPMRMQDAQHVTVPQKLHYRVYGFDVVEEGVSLLTLIDIGGVPKVAEHMWWRPYPARAPSLLWAQ